MNAIFLGEKTHQNFVRMGIGFSGYAGGVIFTSIFLRECIALTARGVEISTELIIRNDRFIAEIGNLISFTVKVAAIASSSMANNLINYIDAYIILCLFCISPFVNN